MNITRIETSGHARNYFRQEYIRISKQPFWSPILPYDSADDGPEVNVIKFFKMCPEGSDAEFVRRAYLEVE